MDTQRILIGINIEWCKHGDIIELILDLNSLTLTFIANDDKDKMIQCDVAEAEYRLALTMDEHSGAKFAFL